MQFQLMQLNRIYDAQLATFHLYHNISEWLKKLILKAINHKYLATVEPAGWFSWLVLFLCGWCWGFDSPMAMVIVGLIPTRGLLLSTMATGHVIHTDTGSTSYKVLVYSLSLRG